MCSYYYKISIIVFSPGIGQPCAVSAYSQLTILLISCSIRKYLTKTYANWVGLMTMYASSAVSIKIMPW